MEKRPLLETKLLLSNKLEEYLLSCVDGLPELNGKLIKTQSRDKENYAF